MEDSWLPADNQLLYLVVEPLIDYPFRNTFYEMWNAGIISTIFQVSVDKSVTF